ncbi:metallophosphoesterase, partial [Mangrovimonas sp. AS39]|uniref:metallophosphoesterase n=1 Tax=Mangrovimonas futianensis TaxID=2895523 RepID=UPI001E3EA4EC
MTSDELWDSIRDMRVPYQSHEAANIKGVDLDISYFEKADDIVSRPYNRIIHMTDWHIPFERDDLIQKIIEIEADKDTTVVVGGDMIDCYAPSSFTKDKFIPLRKEYDIALEYLKLLS